MKLVVIESPYAGDIEMNMEYLEDCIRDSISRGEAPFASHAIYPKVLDDNNPIERAKGIQMGMAWAMQCKHVVFYIDLGMSKGMKEAFDFYTKPHSEFKGKIEIRCIA
jgi:hypothetical protein